ncbi:MAG: RNA-binding S4 domain-containing protein [Firmicutes bacterium]|nr:RNA-binding S4 domain-containing protein [Bacillota bacterium]
MRIDKYLKVSRLIKRRTLAKEALDQGRVSVNGRVVKASYEVKVGDLIELNLPSGLRAVRVEAVRENVPAQEASTLYREV